MPHDAPNDVVVRRDGTIWFTDPHYGLQSDYEGLKQSPELPPSVYCFDPVADVLTPSGAMASGGATAGGVTLTLGDASIDLVPASPHALSLTGNAACAAVANAAFQHLAIVTCAMRAATRQLACYAPVPISSDGAVRLPETSGGVTASKFRDPDGHAVALIFFPPGTGHPKWQSSKGAGPNLGIDHTAIGVVDAGRSMAFYTEVLDFTLLSRQMNGGVEQARLDGVDSARVDVIGLSPRHCGTPHLELLAYRLPTPSPRLPLPPLAEDCSDRMSFIVDDLSLLAGSIGQCAGRHERPCPFPVQTLLRDPDGHLILLQQARPDRECGAQ